MREKGPKGQIMPNQTFHQVPDSAAFYVRNALDRAIRQAKEVIDKNQKFLVKMASTPKPNVPAEYIEEMTSSAKFIIDYQRQWLREAQAEFAKLPDALRPPTDD
jgi:hypothetical protein